VHPARAAPGPGTAGASRAGSPSGPTSGPHDVAERLVERRPRPKTSRRRLEEVLGLGQLPIKRPHVLVQHPEDDRRQREGRARGATKPAAGGGMLRITGSQRNRPVLPSTLQGWTNWPSSTQRCRGARLRSGRRPTIPFSVTPNGAELPSAAWGVAVGTDPVTPSSTPGRRVLYSSEDGDANRRGEGRCRHGGKAPSYCGRRR
jgi:hypothetical protein